MNDFKMLFYNDYLLYVANSINSKIDRRDFPTPLRFRMRFKNCICGYCPSCGGTVLIRKTVVRKIKGACCSWCGQRLEVNFKDDESKDT